jgi:hypothetical protein
LPVLLQTGLQSFADLSNYGAAGRLVDIYSVSHSGTSLFRPKPPTIKDLPSTAVPGLGAEIAAFGYQSRALWNSGQGAFGYPRHAPSLAAGDGLKKDNADYE